MNYKNLDTYEKLLNFVKVPDGIYEFEIQGKVYEKVLTNYWITDTLISNKLVIDFFNENEIQNHVGGTYTFFNDVNVTSSYVYNKSEKKYQIKKGFENCPFQGMNWSGALEFAHIFGGRLPTELEWEICAKAGHAQNLYPWGNEPADSSKANYGNILGRISEVRAYPPNEWGLYDMAGNLREWCMDSFQPDFPFCTDVYPDINSASKVVKGGAWDKTAEQMKCRYREGKWFRIGTMGIGFRICKTK